MAHYEHGSQPHAPEPLSAAVSYRVYPGLLTAAERAAIEQLYGGQEEATAQDLWTKLPEAERSHRVNQSSQLGYRTSHGIVASNLVHVFIVPTGVAVFVRGAADAYAATDVPRADLRPVVADAPVYPPIGGPGTFSRGGDYETATSDFTMRTA